VASTLVAQGRFLEELYAVQRPNSGPDDPRVVFVEFTATGSVMLGTPEASVEVELTADRSRLHDLLGSVARPSLSVEGGSAWKDPQPGNPTGYPPSIKATPDEQWAEALQDLGTNREGLRYRGSELRYRRVERIASVCRVTITDGALDTVVDIPLDTEEPLVGMPYSLADAAIRQD
jgi:hypothetical protein